MEKLILITLAIGLVGQFTCAAPAGSAKFKPRSFSVVTRTTSQTKLVSEAVESYSFEQKRGIIDYRLFMADTKDELGLDSTAHYFHEQERDIAIAYGSYGKDCKQVGRKSIFKTLTLQPDSAFDLFPLGDEFEFVTGPARAMLYVINNLFDINDKPDNNAKSRNVEAVTYEYMLKDSIILHATFMKPSIDSLKEQLANQQKSPEMIVPIDIEIFYPREKSKEDDGFHYDFYRISYREFEFLDSKDRKQVDNLSVDMEFDKFMLNLYPTCSKLLLGKKEVLFQDRNKRSSRFSFKSKISTINHFDGQVKKSAFVAYDGNLNTMLIERWNSNSREKEESDYEKLIYNFNVNRYYHTEVKEKNSIYSSIDHPTCIISRMFADDNKIKLSVTDMLFGTDEFIYLGRAHIRGIPARVYHSVQENINTPFWLEGSSVFVDKSSWAANANGTVKEKPRNSANLQVILYLAAQSDGPGDKGDKILRTIVTNHNYGSTESMRSHLAALYDFTWNLDFESPKGNRLIDFFSLEDDCPGIVTTHNRAKIDLLLYPTEEISATSSLINHNERNLALLASLQKDSEIPSVSISDLESKIIMTKAIGNKLGSAQALKASFKLTSHTRYGVNMVYLGTGTISNLFESVEVTTQASVLDCFLRAAHKKIDVFFAYSSSKLLCYVDQKSAFVYTDLGAKETKVNFGPFDPSNPDVPVSAVVIYKTLHFYEDNSFSIPHLTTINDEHSHKLNHIMELFDLGLDKPRKFTINRFNVKLELAPLVRTSKNQMDENVYKLSGYGLLADNANGVVLKPEKLEQKAGESIETEITFDQCHLACMKDFKCKSFSVCIRNFATECVLSTVDLDLKQVSSQLATSDTNKSFSSNKRIKVKLNDEKKSEIELIKHSTCELYKKSFLEMFEFGGTTILTHEVKPIAASNIGECAERCVKKNLLLIGKDAEQFKKTEELFKSKSVDFNALKEINRQHKEVKREFCKNFKYIGQTHLQSLGADFVSYFQKLAENLQDFNGKDKTVDGYCVLMDDSDLNDSTKAAKMSKQIISESYNFNPEFFYDKTSNYKLFSSEMTKTEQDALVNVAGTFNHPIAEVNLEIMKSFLARGGNIAQVEDLPSKHCAARCFFQESTLWPACKSFDVIHEYGKSRDKVYCVFHTITLSEARERNKSELIFHLDESQNDRADVKMWHFDPRPGLALEISQLSELAQLDQDKFSFISMPKGGSFVFGVSAMIVIGVIAGILVGLKYGEPVVAVISTDNRRASIGQDLIPTDAL